MANHLSSYGELLAMTRDDLRKDIRVQRMLVRRMRLGIELKKEKDAAKYRREKRHLARMLTALENVGAQAPKVLKAKPKSRKVAPSASAPKAAVSSSNSSSK